MIHSPMPKAIPPPNEAPSKLSLSGACGPPVGAEVDVDSTGINVMIGEDAVNTTKICYAFLYIESGL